MTDKVYTACITYHNHYEEAIEAIRNNSKEKICETLDEAKEWLKTEIRKIHDDDFLLFSFAKIIINGNYYEPIVLSRKVIYSFDFDEDEYDIIEFKMEKEF